MFLTGIGVWENDALTLHLVFLRSPDEELAAMHYIEDVLAAWEYLREIGIAEETPKAELRAPNSSPTVVRGALFLPLASSHKPQAASLLDVEGRKVLELRAGANDVSALSPGIYFVRQASSIGREASSVVKVVVTR